MDLKPEDEVRQALRRAGVILTEGDRAAVTAMAERMPRGLYPQRGTEPALVHVPQPWPTK